jgi:hypothetical protein
MRKLAPFLAFAFLALFCNPEMVIADVTAPSGTKNIYTHYKFNRLNLYLLDDVYLADDSANTMVLNAPELADDNTVFTFPPTNGTLDYGLTTNGAGVTTWNEVLLPAKAQTVTNKTIDADNNTISNLEHGAEVDNPSSGVHGVTGDVVGTTDTQTITNKTIDADSNTVSNIDNDEIKAAAAIDLNKLAATTADRALVSDGSGFVSPSSVTSTELGYVSGVTSALQGQIDDKVAKAGDSMSGELIIDPVTGTYGLDVDVTDTTKRGARFKLPASNSLPAVTLFHAGTGTGILGTIGDNNAMQMVNNSTSGTALLRNQNASGPVLSALGSTSGTIDISVPNAVTSYGITLPAAQGGAGQILKNTAGDGVLDWASADLVDDLSPQLGADLDVNGFEISSASNGDVVINPNGTGKIVLDDGAANTVGQVWTSTDTAGAGNWEDAAGGDLVDDLTPQLGGDLDVNSFKLVSTSNGDIALEPDGTGTVTTNVGIVSTVPSPGGPSVFPADETHATPSSTGASYFAQSFTAAATGTPTSIDLSLVAGGGTTGTYTVSLWSDNGSNEPQTQLCTTAPLDLSLVTTTEPPITTHAITGCPVVTSSVKYLAVVDRTGLTSGSLSAKVNTGNPYAGGNYISSGDAVTWTQQASFDTKIVVTAQNFIAGPASFTSAHGDSEHIRLYNPGETASVLIKTGGGLSNYILTLPDAQGAANSVLENDGAGNLSWGTAGQLVSDLSPQLGADLDVNGFEISSASNGDVVLNPNGTGKIVLDDGAANAIGEAWIATDTAGAGNWAAIPSGDVVDDTTPQLGGDLDVNGNLITSASDGDVSIEPDGEGNVTTDAGIIIDVPSESGAPSDAINETTYATVTTATQTYFGQFFQSASTGSPVSGSFTFFQNGSATGTLTASIYTDSGSEPNTLVCTSAGLDASTVTTDTGFPLAHTEFTFVGCPSISSGTNYHMIVDTTGLTGGSLTAKVSSSSQYSPGNFLRSTDFVTWSQFATLEMEIVVVTQVINDNDYSIKSINGQSKHFELSNSLDTAALTIKTGNSLTSHTLTLPESQGSAGSVLENDGSGVLSWAAPSSGVTIETPSLVSDCTVSEQTICVPQNVEDSLTETNLANLDSVSVTNYTHTFTGLSIVGSFLVTIDPTNSAQVTLFRLTLPGAGTNYNTKVNGIHGSCGSTTSGASSDALGIYRAGTNNLFVYWAQSDTTASRTFRCNFSGYVDDI